ncbi:SDR family oxidoreductase [Glycomyces terrestris]|uniref:NAD-dependent epimerase/dehydratase family protein n=1 Tax=Glycomyces terrestris TaxID=2493553 RepID=A0A426V3C6_9ACTN|nr:NAD(P)H-binding protein [Glycomyces terrestris]RRS01367.1 NAD-dependent epimerase/dehydratase family protein [Glycomyces terrestris]
MSDHHVLVTGARGNIGSRVVRALAAAGHAVRASARDTAGLAVPDGAEAVRLDLLDPTGAEAALDGARALFLYPTFGDLTGFLDAAVKAGVEHAVLLSSPAAYEPVEHDGPIGAAHQAIERAVRDSGLAHTVLYPSWLGSNVFRDWADGVRAGRVSIAFPEWRINPIHLGDVAEVAAELLTRDRFRGRRLDITGPASLSQREAVDAIAAELGRPVEVEELTRGEALAGRPAWFPEAMFDSLLSAAETLGDTPAPVTNNVERVLGRPARTFAQWLRDERDSF